MLKKKRRKRERGNYREAFTAKNEAKFLKNDELLL